MLFPTKEKQFNVILSFTIKMSYAN